MLPMTPILGARTERAWHFDVSGSNPGSGSPPKTKRVHGLRSNTRGNSTRRGQNRNPASQAVKHNIGGSTSFDFGAQILDMDP